MDGQAQFVGTTGLAFGLVGLALLITIGLHIWILVKVYQNANLLVRVVRRHFETERARREIQERDRIRVAKMIRRRVTEDEWIQFLAELGENPTKPKEQQ